VKRTALLAVVSIAISVTPVSAVAAGAHGKSAVTKVAVTEGKPSEFHYTLSKKTVPMGTVVFAVTDKGTLGHDFKVCSSSKGGTANSCTGKGTKVLSPGKSATLTIVFKKKGTYEYLCTVAGHAAGGMKGDLKVT
jgi:uncharacterized cupredoxin-like copper-binding protein